MKKCVIIYNPQSGKLKKGHFLQTFYDLLRKHGYEAEIRYTKKKKDATEIVKNLEDVDLVISAGGDGTCAAARRPDLLRIGRLRRHLRRFP